MMRESDPDKWPDIVAGVFKTFAGLVLVGGVLEPIELFRKNEYVTNRGLVEVTIIAGAILTASALAFFGYVLNYLRDIRANTADLVELGLIEDDDEGGVIEEDALR